MVLRTLQIHEKYYYHTGLKAYSSPYQDSASNLVQIENFHSTPVTSCWLWIKTKQRFNHNNEFAVEHGGFR